MAWLCVLRDRELSRLHDRELAPRPAERLVRHVENCARCAARLAALVRVDLALSRAPLRLVGGPRPEPARRFLAVAAGAALVASAAANLLLSRPSPRPGLWDRPAATDRLANLVARLEHPPRSR
jgi:ribosomal protein S14